MYRKTKLFIFLFYGILFFFGAALLISQQGSSEKKSEPVVRKRQDLVLSQPFSLEAHLPKIGVQYKTFVLVEGEDAIATNFSKEKTFNYFCSSSHALQLSRAEDPQGDKGYFASYIVNIPANNRYLFWLASSPIGSRYADKPGYASPIEWQIDGKPFIPASSENILTKAEYAPGGFFWNRVGAGYFTAGKHTVTIRVKQKRSSGWDYFLYIDALLFVPESGADISGNLPMPKFVPKNLIEQKEVKLQDLQYYRKQLEADPDHAPALLQLATLYSMLYDYDKSIALYERYLKKKRDDEWVQILLANNYAWANRLDDAISAYKNIIILNPKNILARKLLAILAGWNNRYDEAIRNYEEIIVIDPKDAEAYVALATQYSWKGKMNKALEYFQAAEKLQPENIAILYILGDNYQWSGKPFKAIEQFSRIIGLDEKEINAYKKLANLYLDMGEEKKAEQIMLDARRMLNIYPELAVHSLNIQDDRKKTVQNSINSYLAELKKSPENQGIRMNLLDTYRWNHMHAQAEKEFINILNFRVLQSLEQNEVKSKALILALILHRTIQNPLKRTNDTLQSRVTFYQGLRESLSTGKELPQITQQQLQQDISLVQQLLYKNNQLERLLIESNTIHGFYQAAIKTFQTQQKALQWQMRTADYLDRAKQPRESGDSLLLKNEALLQGFFGSRDQALAIFEKLLNPLQSRSYLSFLNFFSKQNPDQTVQKIANLAMPQQDAFLAAPDVKKIQTWITDFQLVQRDTSITLGQKYRDNLVLITDAMIKETKRMQELLREQDQFITKGDSTLYQLAQKAILAQEIENEKLYRELASYKLNQEAMLPALYWYERILQVQPMNVSTNLQVGTIHQILGNWHSALHRYELALQAQPNHERALANFVEIRREYSLQPSNEFHVTSDNLTSKIENHLFVLYPMNDWLTLQTGYILKKMKDETVVEKILDQFYSPATGDAFRHQVYVNADMRIGYSQFFANFRTGINLYQGTLTFTDENIQNNISYHTLNYQLGITYNFLKYGISLKGGYAKEDIDSLVQSLRLEDREEITSDTFLFTMYGSLEKLRIPYLENFSFYNSLTYKMLSDSNSRQTLYNEFTYMFLRFPAQNLRFYIAGIYSLENTAFTAYTDGSIPQLPYWAPQNWHNYGGRLRIGQSFENIAKGRLEYNLNFDYILNNNQHKTFGGGLQLDWSGSYLRAHAAYSYSYTKATLPGSDPYKSHNVEISLTGKLYHTKIGRKMEAKSILLVEANPRLITPNQDGVQDYTVFSVTTFDTKGISKWTLNIIDKYGKLVHAIGRDGTPPATIRWDGSDKAGNILPGGVYQFQLAIVNSAGETKLSKGNELVLSRSKRALSLEANTAIFSPNKDGIKDAVRFEIKATDKQRIDKWFFSIRDNAGRAIVESQGIEFLPYDIAWDGLDSSGNLCNDGKYSAVLRILYKDGKTIQSEPTQVVLRTQVSIGIEIPPQILLKPERQKIVLKLNVSDGNAESWRVKILGKENSEIKVFHGNGLVPPFIEWDGLDQDGNVPVYHLPVVVIAEMVDQAGNKALSKLGILWYDFKVTQSGPVTIIYVFNQNQVHGLKQIALTTAGKEMLVRLLQKLKQLILDPANKELEIQVHTSQDSSEKQNEELARARGDQLKKQIAEQISFAEIQVKIFGETMPYIKGKSSPLDSRYVLIVKEKSQKTGN